MSKLTQNILSQTSFWMVNKAITQYLGSRDAALLLSDLVGRRNTFAQKGQLDSLSGFFVISEEIENDLLMTKHIRTSAMRCLQDKGLVVVSLKPTPTQDKGFQTVNFFYIQDDKIEEVLKEVDMGGGRQKSCPPGAKNCTTNKNPSTSKEIQFDSNTSSYNEHCPSDPRDLVTVGSSCLGDKSVMPAGHGASPKQDADSYNSHSQDDRNTSPVNRKGRPHTNTRSADEIIQGYLSECDNFDILKDRRTRKETIADLVGHFKIASYSEDEVRRALDKVLPYAVPNEDMASSAKRKLVRDWKDDFKRQWNVSVKSAYAAPKPEASEKVYGKAAAPNRENLSIDIDELMKGQSK